MRCICNEHLCAPLERHAVRNDDGVNDHDTELVRRFFFVTRVWVATQQTVVVSLDGDWTV